jgi:hypothetical protein
MSCVKVHLGCTVDEECVWILDDEMVREEQRL